MGILDEMDRKEVKTIRNHVWKHHTNSGKGTRNNPNYMGEKHGLQGKTGKTLGVC